MPGRRSRSRAVTLLAALAALVIPVSGCAIAAKEVGEIVLKIGTDVIIQAGADYIEKILSPGDAKGNPTLIVSYTNSGGDGVGTDYALANAKEISTQNVTIQNVRGDIHIVADGNGIAVTAASGTTGTVAIHSSGGGGGGQSAGGADDQAATISGILGWSGRSRKALFGALADLGECRNVSGATSALRSVAADRGQQIDALVKIDVSALPAGGTLQGVLLQALRSSLQADQAFVRWGEQPRCHQDSNYREAMSYSRSATAAKQQFVGEWNPIASTYGLPELDEPDI